MNLENLCVPSQFSRNTVFGLDFGRLLTLARSPNLARGKTTIDEDVFGETGIVSFKSLLSREETSSIKKSYNKYVDYCLKRRVSVQDENSRYYRLTNFHLLARDFRDAILSSDAMETASSFFGSKSGIYTSLYFKNV